MERAPQNIVTNFCVKRGVNEQTRRKFGLGLAELFWKPQSSPGIPNVIKNSKRHREFRTIRSIGALSDTSQLPPRGFLTPLREAPKKLNKEIC